MRRHEVKDFQKAISEHFSKGISELPNGNTPSPLSPTNSVGSQVTFEFNLIQLRKIEDDLYRTRTFHVGGGGGGGENEKT